MRDKASLAPWFSDKVPSSLGFLDFAGWAMGLTEQQQKQSISNMTQRVLTISPKMVLLHCLVEEAQREARASCKDPFVDRSNGWLGRVWALLLFWFGFPVQAPAVKRKSRRLAQPSGVSPCITHTLSPRVPSIFEEIKTRENVGGLAAARLPDA